MITPVTNRSLGRCTIAFLALLAVACSDSSITSDAASRPDGDRADAAEPLVDPSAERAPADGGLKKPPVTPTEHPEPATAPTGGPSAGGDVRFVSLELTRAQALDWWTIRPFLELTGPLASGDSDPAYLIKAADPYHERDPRKDPSSLSVVHVPRGEDWRESDWAWVGLGGVVVTATSYPAGTEVIRPSTAASERQEAVTVRGHPGTYTDLAGVADGHDLSFVLWNELADDGTFVSYGVYGGPETFDRDELVAMADTLTETR